MFLSQVNSSDIENNKFYMVLKYSHYGWNNLQHQTNNKSSNQFISEYADADIIYIIIISIYSCTIFTRTEITFEGCNFQMNTLQYAELKFMQIIIEYIFYFQSPHIYKKK